jgi:peptide/nickel transport system permease protein
MGFIAGKVLAWRRGGLLEYVTTLGGVGLYTVFTPWFALMMIWIFAFSLGLFPIGKFIEPGLWRDAPVAANFVFNRILLTGFIASILFVILLQVTRRISNVNKRVFRWVGVGVIVAGIVGYWLILGTGRYALDILQHMILPILTVALISFAGTMLLTRSSMLETLREDYILTARAKGLPERVVRDKHAARNALLPVVTALVFSLAFSLSGGVITETVFSWPGMGLTLLAAAQVSDIPMVIGSMVFIGILALTAHLVADILYAFLDPRIRYT